MMREEHNITIQPARPHHIPDILALNNALNGPGLSTAQHMAASLQQNKNEIVLVAVHNNKVVGFICGQLFSSICYANHLQCEITELMVDENYRRAGIATMLIEHIEQEFARHNITEITVATGKANVNAQKLYDKCGYEYRRMTYLKPYPSSCDGR